MPCERSGGAAEAGVVLDAFLFGRRLDLAAVDRARARLAGSGADELTEERLWAVGPGVELRVVLGGDEERMVVQLDHLDQALVRRGAAADQTLVFEPAPQLVVHLVTVAVALVDDGLAEDFP